MSSIDDLIKQYCPEGVEFKPLGEAITALRTGLNPRDNFKLNTPDASGYYVTVRELAGKNIILSRKTDRVSDEALAIIQRRSKLQIGDVLFSGTGTIGRTALIRETPTNWNIKEGIYAITPKQEIISSDFLLHLLLSDQVINQLTMGSTGSTVVSIPMANLKCIKIPVPPFEVQQEIVNILDTFTELEAELEARKKQYHHYREELFGFDKNQAEYLPMGQVGKFVRGNGLQKKDFTETGVGCILK